MTAIALAGQGILEFEKETHDFGQIKETNASVEYSFSFVNTGDAPSKIINVKASCGCTTSYWTKEEILPGDSGLVTALYSTVNRPGPFTKSLLVTSSASNSEISLFITGHVTPRAKTIEDRLTIKLGAMRVKYRSFNLEKITNEKPVVKKFDVYNNSDSVLVFIADSTETPDHLRLAFEPLELQPKEEGLIKITYDPVKKNDLGYQTDGVIFLTNEKTDSIKRIRVTTTIEEYFAPVSEEELAMVPKLAFKKKSHDFGKVEKGSVLTAAFILTNEGKQDLNIRQVKANCDCIRTTSETDTLKPGEEAKMNVTFDTEGRKGKQFKSVSIFSNDPIQPSQMIQVKATIKE